jgi:ParB family chromosome partitioning protein
MTKGRGYTIKSVAREGIRGVDREILGKTVDNGVYPLSMAKEIRLDRMKPDPNQPRKTFDPKGLQELATSIREQGILQPLVVEFVADDERGHFRLIHGERRWRAAQMAGLETVPAVIREIENDATRLVQRLMENIQREDLNAVDRAEALQALKEHLGGVSWEKVGEKVGIGKRRVLQLVATTDLPPLIQADVRAGVVTEKQTRVYRGLSPEQQVELHQARREQSLSARQVTELAKRAKGEPGFTMADGIREIQQGPRRQSDPLAGLVRLGKAIEKIEPGQVDTDRLQQLLAEIVAKASALLEEIQEPGIEA